jgi:hypothetical protein
MANCECPHKSNQKVFFFKWWLCPVCREQIAEQVKRTEEEA